MVRLLKARRQSGLGSAGYLVERSIGEGIDFIVGLERDSVFGYSLMLGSGGVLAEIIEDACFCILPAEPAELARLPARTYSRLLLPGFRGAPPADLKALLHVLQVVARLPEALPPGTHIACEINPLRVMPEGSGAWVLDAKLRVDG
jgi:acetyltransferase